MTDGRYNPDDDWRTDAACRGSTGLFFQPCTHYRQPEGTTCEVCGLLVDRRPRPAGERWSPNTAAAICATCPVRIECLTYAVDAGEHHGIWGGAGGYVLRRLTRARRRVDHDYQPDCDCEACDLMTAHLNGERVNGNTDGITHGLPGNYGRGCRCARCTLSRTTTGVLLIAAGWKIADWWDSTGLPVDADDPTVLVDRARRLVAAGIAATLRGRLAATGHDVAWLATRAKLDIATDTLIDIVCYRDTSEPFAAHLNVTRARKVAAVIGIDLADLISTTVVAGRRVA